MDIALLKQQVYEANIELFRRNMIIYTWGNVSGIDRERGIVVIKPSGVAYETMRVDQMVMLDLERRASRSATACVRPATRPRIWRCIARLRNCLRRYAYAFAVCSRVCSGGARTAVLWHDPRGLLLRHGAGHAQFDREEIDRAYEAETGTVIIEALPDARLNTVRRCWCAGTGRSHGAPALWTACIMPSCWRNAAKWR